MTIANILVCEDEGIVAKDIQNTLEKMGYTVSFIVSSGEEAVQKAAGCHPDIVLMDIRLKGKIDGVEAAKKIYQDFNIPVIYITASADTNTLERAKVTKPFGYIAKPFRERELQANIEIAISQHLLEKRLKEKEEWLLKVIKSMGEGLITTDINGAVTFMNPVAETLTGWRISEALGRNAAEVLVIANAETRNTIESFIKIALEEDIVVGLPDQTILITKNGAEIPIDNSTAPIKDDRGNITGTVLVFWDVTRSKQAQETLTQQAQELTRYNTELEQFTYMACHNLQEPLHMVTRYAQMLAQRYKEKLDEDADRLFNSMIDSANWMQKLIQNLLAYSLIETRGRDFEIVAWETVFEEAIANLQTAIEENGAAITSDPLPVVWGDSTQLRHLLQNLIENAIQFRSEESPRIHVSARATEKEWIFSVRDNGIGIAPQRHDSIFVVFQGLHHRESHSGTGVGLATCKKIVERHGGRIWVESQPGAGSSFYFTIPVATEVGGISLSNNWQHVPQLKREATGID